MSARAWVVALLAALGVLAATVLLVPRGPRPVRIGSKAFTEGVVLGDLLRLVVESEGVACEHLDGMGGTRIVYGALVAGEIDAYVEYTGTLQRDILARGGRRSSAAIRETLEARGIRTGPTLGFDNTYALGMRRDRAARLGVESIGDLRDHPDLALGFSHEFMERADGWPGLERRYGLPHRATGLDHDLAYRAVASGDLDVTDLYSTDAKIPLHDLVVLEDDLGFFPAYEAIVLYRADLEHRYPDVVAAFDALRDRIDAERMAEMNAAVEVDEREEIAVAAEFLEEDLGWYVAAEVESRLERLVRTTGEHATLVAVSLAVAVLLGLVLGVAAAKTRLLGQAIIGVVGAAQTFPGLALLALFVPLLGIGWLPTMVALVVYSLLPIVRNTFAGITGIPRPLAESAEVLGLSPRARLGRIELPLAAPSILAGVKTAAVWNVGLATLGALIGAGGYGQSILKGIRRDDSALILDGAVPAIAMALLVQVLFDALERVVVSPGLRRAPRAAPRRS